MRNSVLDDPRLYSFLCVVDLEFATAARAAGCPHCGGDLHSARYPRSIHGIGAGTDATDRYRASFCCAQDGCRRRVTPPSVRFLGRKRFLSAVVLLVSAARHGARPVVAHALQSAYGVSRSTLGRWQRWWRESVPKTAFWSMAKARLMPPVDRARVAAELVQRFDATVAIENLIRVLRFIAPLHHDARTLVDSHGYRGSHGARRV